MYLPDSMKLTAKQKRIRQYLMDSERDSVTTLGGNLDLEDYYFQGRLFLNNHWDNLAAIEDALTATPTPTVPTPPTPPTEGTKGPRGLKDDWTINVSELSYDARKLLAVNLRALTNQALGHYRWIDKDLLGALIVEERRVRGMVEVEPIGPSYTNRLHYPEIG